MNAGKPGPSPLDPRGPLRVDSPLDPPGDREALRMDAQTPSCWNRLSLWLLLALLLFFVVLSVQVALKAAKGGQAIERWRNQIQALSDGENIYERYNYPNPPIMA